MRARQIAICAAAAAMLCAPPHSALAQANPDHCFGSPSDDSVNAVIADCSAAIASGRWKGAELATAYYNRGNAYFAGGQYAPALRDFDAVLRLTPNDATALNNRGLAKIQLGDVKGGQADIAAAKTRH